MTEANGQFTAQLETEAEASTESTEQLKILKYLFIVGGEKGGVGKTWFTYILIELLLQLDREPTILDLDKTTPNVAKAYLKSIYQQWLSVNIQTHQVFEPIERAEGDREDRKNRLNELLSKQILLSDNSDDTKSREGASHFLFSDRILIR